MQRELSVFRSWPLFLACIVFVGGLESHAGAEEGAAVSKFNPIHVISRLLFGRGSESTADGGEVPATHHQVGTLKVLESPDPQGHTLASFCLNADGNILAAVSASLGEVRVLSPQGELLGTWPLPINPEAINVGPENTVLVAGGGKILVLNASGEVVREAEAPHVANIRKDREAIRREVEEQMRASAKSMQESLGVFQTMATDLLKSKLSNEESQERQLLATRIAQLQQIPEADRTSRERRGLELRGQLLETVDETAEWQLSDAERLQITSYRQQIKFFREYVAQNGGTKLTDQNLEAMVDSTIASKCGVASISTDSKDIFLATGAAKGYGFDVWRINADLEEPVCVVKGLRGCCGQMDVQVREDGIYVAENARHRVSHYDRDGNRVKDWGSMAESGVEGFGDCCNPMNVAFGNDGSVYTSESNSGRIKKYSAEGALQALVGKVELVPGCKKVSIAVSQDGQRVYMLDITRNHIVVMEANPPAPPEEQQTVAGDSGDA